jgi:hypothetical protein
MGPSSKMANATGQSVKSMRVNNYNVNKQSSYKERQTERQKDTERQTDRKIDKHFFENVKCPLGSLVTEHEANYFLKC